MTWRDRLAVAFGPGLFCGMTAADWLGALRSNRFAIHPRYLLRAAAISLSSVINSIAARQDQRKYGEKVAQSVVLPPLFVLGHWRSGTTHLHNLLSLDDRFAFPNLFQVLYPHTFLSAEGGRHYSLLRFFLPRKRPMDAMHLSLSAPWEDEYATCVGSLISSYMGPIFPRRRAHYDRYMTFRDVPESEVARWQASLMLLLKKLTYKYRRPLILKSPPHTCRIRLLLEMFPNAKFIHIHRHPIDVFRSTQHQTEVMLRWYELQRFPRGELDEWIIERYRRMYDVFFEERSLIPKGCFHEVSFQDLEADPTAAMRGIYSALDLPHLGHAEPRLREYVASLAGYRRNAFAKVPPAVHARIIDQWHRSFAEWGYSADCPESRL